MPEFLRQIYGGKKTDMIKKSCLPILIFCLCLSSLLHAQEWMPDAHLERAIREALDEVHTLI